MEHGEGMLSSHRFGLQIIARVLKPEVTSCFTIDVTGRARSQKKHDIRTWKRRQDRRQQKL
jgi:hypothetical protein